MPKHLHRQLAGAKGLCLGDCRSDFDDQGNRIGAIESIRDITERKQDQEELQNNLKFLETLIETIPSPIFFKDIQGRYLGCNDAFARQIIGMPKEDIIGKTVLNCRRKSLPTWRISITSRTRGCSVSWASRCTKRRCNATMANCEISTSPKRPLEILFGEVAGIVGVMLDITKRKQAELSREQSLDRQERLNLLQQTLLSPGKLQQKLKKITDMWWDIFGADFCRIWVTGPETSARRDAHMQRRQRGRTFAATGIHVSGSLRVQDGIRIRTVRFIDACLRLL